MYVLLAVALLVYWYSAVKWQRRHYDKLYGQLKISAPRLPFVGHLYLLFGNEEEKMIRLQQLGKEVIDVGGTAGLWIANKLYIHIADSEVADIVLKTCLEKDDIVKCFHVITGESSLFASVKTWRPRRKYLTPTFSIKNLNRYVKPFSEQSSALVQKLHSMVGVQPMATENMYGLYTMNSIFSSLGITVNALESAEHPLMVALEEVMSAVGARVLQPWLYNDSLYKLTPRYQTSILRHRTFVFEFFDKVIQERRKLHRHYNGNLNKGRTITDDGTLSFIDALMELPANVSDVLIREECVGVIAAASDTSAVSLGYVTMLLARHPEMQNRVFEELKDTLDDFDRDIMSEDLNSFKYLDAFIRETLRLYPPVPLILRKIENPIKLPSGITLLPGCGALINIWAINRNPMYWGEDAEEFRPERFLDGTPRHKAAFISFSHGPRNCLGLQYAMMSVKTVMATILKDYRILPASDDLKNKPLRVKFNVMMRPVDHFRAKFERRQ